jgi:hypothetical protein
MEAEPNTTNVVPFTEQYTHPEVGNKTHAQVKRIFGLARERGVDDDELHALVLNVTQRTSSIRALMRDDADRVIERLGGEALCTRPSRRTIQRRRQKAGSKQLSTAAPAHLELMRSLARTRNMSDEGLEQLSLRIIKHYPPRTTAETNKVVEALKAMNRRNSK